MNPLLVCIPLSVLALACCADGSVTEHVRTTDFPVVNDAFLHGYAHNKVTDTISGKQYRTIAIQCVNSKVHIADAGNEFRGFSVWTRDVYWGSLGWLQAGDGEVVSRVRTSIEALIACKNLNKADGHVEWWPLANGRYYIPQAWTTGGKIAEGFYPYDSESQADFLLLTHLYWKSSADTAFIKSIWGDIAYVTANIEIMDTNGNSLPDNLWGSYDYQGLGQDMEEPLMCAKASAAYSCVAEMAAAVGHRDEAKRLAALARKVKHTMNLPVSEGGLWIPKPDGGYYANKRVITKGQEQVDETFIPYESLVPMFFGMTDKARNKAILDRLDANFDKYYNLKWGPMYVAPAAHNEKSVIDSSSTPWLGFLDVYLRCKLGRETNRARIFSMLLDHAYDIGAAPFTEGAGIDGSLTGGAGRSWDNGNFFHCLVSGVYGIEKSADHIELTPPTPMEGHALTQLKNIRWHDAVYDVRWEGSGSRISSVTVDSVEVRPTLRRGGQVWVLTERSGMHTVVVNLRR